MRWRVSSRIGTPVSRPLRMRETVVIETPARSATSRRVTGPGERTRTSFVDHPPGRWLAPGLTPGLSFGAGQTSSVIVDPQAATPREHRRCGTPGISRQAHPTPVRHGRDRTGAARDRPGLYDGLRSR